MDEDERCWACGEPFTEEDPHHTRGLHRRCYHRKRREWTALALAIQFGGFLGRKIARKGESDG